jgi:hypothetical protein
MARRTKPVPSQNLKVDGVVGSVQKDGIIFPSLSRAAAAYTSNEYFAGDAMGVRLYIDLTVVNGGTLIVKVQTKDPSSGNWTDMVGAVTTSLAAVATTTLTIEPGVTETANFDVAQSIGASWRVVATTATAAVTFSVGGEYLG